MGALVAGSVTYALSKNKKLEDGRRIVDLTLTFGDGSLTYPTGGVPLSIGKLACPNSVDSLVVVDDGGSAYSFSFVKATNLLMMFGTGTHTHDLLLKNAAVADGAGSRVNAGSNLLGANTGGDLTITGAGANGGVKNNGVGTAGSKVELATSVAPAAQTLKVTVIGW